MFKCKIVYYIYKYICNDIMVFESCKDVIYVYYYVNFLLNWYVNISLIVLFSFSWNM